MKTRIAAFPAAYTGRHLSGLFRLPHRALPGSDEVIHILGRRAFRFCLLIPHHHGSGWQRRLGVRTLKSVFGVTGALVPVLYCGGLLHHFLDLSGSVLGAATIGLGPTRLG